MPVIHSWCLENVLKEASSVKFEGFFFFFFERLRVQVYSLRLPQLSVIWSSHTQYYSPALSPFTAIFSQAPVSLAALLQTP